VVGVDRGVVIGGPAVVGVTLAVVVIAAGALHVAALITLLSRVTAPFRASSRPWIVAPVSAVIDVRARTSPANCVPVLRVAELPTCQTM
jgi:hypothetical protein